MAMSWCFTGCGTDDIDISGYADSEIVLAGLENSDADLSGASMDDDGNVVLTIADLKALQCETIKTESTSDKIGKVRATGPELDTVLAAYGVSKTDFKKIRFYGADEYDIPLMNDYLSEHDIYLAFGIDGEPLDEESVPCRIIIPESDSAYWTRMVNRIEFN